MADIWRGISYYQKHIRAQQVKVRKVFVGGDREVPNKRGIFVNFSGQELVEFAIVIPLLLLIFFGVVDLGRLFHSAITITNAARVGARYGALRSDIYNCVPGNIYCVPICDPNCGPDYFIEITEGEALNNSIDLSTATIVPTCIDGSVGSAGVCDSGDIFRVIVTYDFDLLFGDVISLPPIQLVRSVDMYVQ